MDEDMDRCDWWYLNELGVFGQCSNKGEFEIGNIMICAEHKEVADDSYQDYLSMPEPE